MTILPPLVVNWYSDAQCWLTPSSEHQLKLILEGKCPHNSGWEFHSIGHNDKIFKCVSCGEFASY